jgi:hypothetical protein
VPGVLAGSEFLAAAGDQWRGHGAVLITQAPSAVQVGVQLAAACPTPGGFDLVVSTAINLAMLYSGNLASLRPGRKRGRRNDEWEEPPDEGDEHRHDQRADDGTGHGSKEVARRPSRASAAA